MEDRFWSKVEKTSYCWQWIAGVGSKGYGNFSLNGKTKSAHIIAFYLSRGYWPTQQVLHTCDNRRCVNPNHLYEGTHADNMRDKVLRNRCVGLPTNRGKYGEASHRKRLTQLDVDDIRKRYTNGESQTSITRVYNTNQGHVSRIVTYKAWPVAQGEKT